MLNYMKNQLPIHMQSNNTSSGDSAQSIVDLYIPIEKAQNTQQLKREIANKLKISEIRILDFRCIKKSIDARQQQIKLHMQLEVGVDRPLPRLKELEPRYRSLTSKAEKAIIVGAGPAGMFAALRCISDWNSTDFIRAWKKRLR